MIRIHDRFAEGEYSFNKRHTLQRANNMNEVGTNKTSESFLWENENNNNNNINLYEVNDLSSLSALKMCRLPCHAVLLCI